MYATSGMGQTSSAIPWGQAFASDSSALESFISQYAGWVAIGLLVVLAYASSGNRK